VRLLPPLSPEGPYNLPAAETLSLGLRRGLFYAADDRRALEVDICHGGMVSLLLIKLIVEE
jgi:hypothetical protein